jgi:hypothetical protein
VFTRLSIVVEEVTVSSDVGSLDALIATSPI